MMINTLKFEMNQVRDEQITYILKAVCDKYDLDIDILQKHIKDSGFIIAYDIENYGNNVVATINFDTGLVKSSNIHFGIKLCSFIQEKATEYESEY